MTWVDMKQHLVNICRSLDWTFWIFILCYATSWWYLIQEVTFRIIQQKARLNLNKLQNYFGAELHFPSGLFCINFCILSRCRKKFTLQSSVMTLFMSTYLRIRAILQPFLFENVEWWECQQYKRERKIQDVLKMLLQGASSINVTLWDAKCLEYCFLNNGVYH